MVNWPHGVGRFIYPSLDSTNNEAIRLASNGEPSPFWVLANQQTKGKGRRGRAWVDPKGNFAASLLLRPSKGPSDAALRSFTASLALREALIAHTGRADIFSLKWPNDVLLNDGKLSGILLESGKDAAGDYLCVGIGVNLRHSPDVDNLEDGALPPANLYSETGITLEPVDLLNSLASAFANWEDKLDTMGFAPVRNEWLQHAARIGEIITAKLPNKNITGIFETLDETGAIVLKTSQERLHIPAADIFFTNKGQ